MKLVGKMSKQYVSNHVTVKRSNKHEIVATVNEQHTHTFDSYLTVQDARENLDAAIAVWEFLMGESTKHSHRKEVSHMDAEDETLTTPRKKKP